MASAAALALVPRLRESLGDTNSDSQLWTDDQLGQMIDDGFSEYTYGNKAAGDADLTDDDTTQSLKLARVTALLELAINTALFFKWKDQNKEIDKSMTPGECRRIAKDIHDQVMAHRKAKDDGVGDEGRDRAQGAVMQFNPGTTQAERTQGRGWY